MDRTKLLRGATLATALALGATTTAGAAPLSDDSEVNIVGSVAILPDGLATNATGLDFTDPIFGLVAEGSLAPFEGSFGTITDIAEGTLPLDGPLAITINSFYTLTAAPGTLFFDLLGITDVNRDDVAGEPAVSIAGAGRFRLTGFDDTPATFILTVQGDGRTTFSASTEASGLIDVPEPVSLALFGMGLLGLGAVARARRQG